MLIVVYCFHTVAPIYTADPHPFVAGLVAVRRTSFEPGALRSAVGAIGPALARQLVLLAKPPMYGETPQAEQSPTAKRERTSKVWNSKNENLIAAYGFMFLIFQRSESETANNRHCCSTHTSPPRNRRRGGISRTPRLAPKCERRGTKEADAAGHRRLQPRGHWAACRGC